MKKFFKCLSLCFFSVVIFSCSSNKVEGTELQFQENGLAVLNISEPLVLPSYETANTGDGTFHDASYIAKDMKLGLNLGNTMEAYNASGCEKYSYTWIPTQGSNSASDYETCWGATVTTQEIISSIKAAGFSTVRIPVFWGNMMLNDGTWTINTKYLERVREIVDYCLNENLYAVVNIHHFDEFIIRRNNIDDCKKIFTNIWTQISSYFANYSEKLVFEGYNEYLGGQQFNSAGTLVNLSNNDAYEFTNAMNQVFVDSVRSTGGNNLNRVLIISGYWTNIDLTTSSSFIIPHDSALNKIMVSVHYVDNSMYWTKQIGGANWLNYIDSQCSLLTNAFTSKGIPVFLGETTSQYPSYNFASNKKYETSPECLNYVLDKLLDCGFVPVLWDTPEGFFLRKSKRIANEENAAVIKTIAESLN